MFRNSKDGRMGRKDDFFRLGLLSHYNANFYKAVDCRKILVKGKIEEANKSVQQRMTARLPESRIGSSHVNTVTYHAPLSSCLKR
jgi:hypothetical protein